MLTDEQIENIVTKAVLSPSDLRKLENHIDYIGNTYGEYGEELPQDVFMNLESDLGLIIKRLEIERERLA